MDLQPGQSCAEVLGSASGWCGHHFVQLTRLLRQKLAEAENHFKGGFSLCGVVSQRIRERR